MEDLIEHVESALEDIGEHQRLRRPPAMCFLDLAGYTRITEERGDEVAAELAGELAGIVARTARDHGGQAVKWLGDGVMFHFKEPRRAVRAALRMVRDTPEAGLPPAHVGIHAGPIVFQDGDYFGRTVNLASRVAGRAQAGQVLVTESVVADSEPDADLVFSSIGAAQLKGVAAPVDLFEAAQL